MAEEKKANTIKIKITEKKGWQLMNIHYPAGWIGDVELENYESMKKAVKHEVVK
jgi:hypothetical protein